MTDEASILSSDPNAGDPSISGDGGEDQYLLQAWQNLAMFVACADDPDEANKAMAILSSLKDLLAADNQEDSAADSFTCQYCDRNFSTQQGLVNHLKGVHNKRMKQPYGKSSGSAGPQKEQD